MLLFTSSFHSKFLRSNMSDPDEAVDPLQRVRRAIEELPGQQVGYNSQSDRQKRKRNKQHVIFRELLVKLAGSDVSDQIHFLVDQAKKVSKQTYVHVTLESVNAPPDFATMDRESRRHFRHLHKLVDTVLPLAAGSTSPESQMKLLKARWVVLHGNIVMPSDYSWKTLGNAIVTLPEPTPYNELNQNQKIHSQHAIKIKALDILITKLAGSNILEDQIILISDRLKVIHKKNPKEARFLNLHHLRLLESYLIPLPKFKKPKAEFQDQYDSIKIVAKKLAGTDDPETICCFLRSQFPQLISWNSIFEHTDALEACPQRADFPIKMKALLQKFSGDGTVDFLIANFKVSTSTLSSQFLQDLMAINNHISALRRQKESNEHLKNFKKCIVSCLTRSFSFRKVVEAGWDVTFWFWKACERNRNDETSFYDIDPASNAGRKPITEALANEIGQL